MDELLNFVAASTNRAFKNYDHRFKVISRWHKNQTVTNRFLLSLMVIQGIKLLYDEGKMVAMEKDITQLKNTVDKETTEEHGD